MSSTEPRTSTRELPLMHRDEIEALIANGNHIIIVGQHVLRVDPFMKYHPGGDKAMMHMVGRDATDEVTMYAALVFCADNRY